ncbi:transcriptional regulator family: C2H2 zinc finger [Penicillium roqueforti]|uniref:Zinc finger C2H2-type/integrase DNA-binding domain n=1 Tax=Penicillium roqueforti (strain FM164) TaxID=1365484 RepID=W6QU09_PENRF|nr:transcriptional regulator family: C2H2 zinc finger [Penicillium roqueforti]CDM37629.1 Zinc finger C2H2-type/integrase DNA-binding domain [Penicillium roqueforti FM164]KAI2696551.1 transcriptional regulator family: C2H2 zinc finger [Penicillium roqueforti]KAI2712626.1 transcriptional regulator family: C2H2 zinc finger [Penicillium roqueforti]KAI3065591.1 transcriptional regulator family: C2H2 zinc finger [Penicillium roqueforti]
METSEPVSYDFPGHAVSAFAHRRSIDSTLSHNFPFYSHQTASYSLHYQTSSSLPYSFGHSVGHTHAHSNPYQQYFVHSQHPLQPQPLRTTAQPLQSLPEIRPAKNAISHTIKSTPDHAPRVHISTGSHSSPVGAKNETKQTTTDLAFSTNVDVLMKAIQAKHASLLIQQSLPPLQHPAPPAPQTYAGSYPTASPTPPRYPANETQPSRRKRKYNCTLPGCGKSFAQKTHLEIHIRAHTGDKPFICKEPSCGQRFSQQGNLKTHQRRHTGEKPFQCDICHKPFAQRGNLRAHRLTHDQSKRFDCRLDECGKQFTQLGNLKSHQNKFHAATLHNLTIRFSQMAENGPMNMNAADRDLWIYFAGLYKNSNKGIKGRGKDRRISMTRRSDPKSRCAPVDRVLMDRIQSVGSEEGVSKMQLQMQMRRGSFEDGFSVYNTSSSDGDDGDSYYIERKPHVHVHGHSHGHGH